MGNERESMMARLLALYQSYAAAKPHEDDWRAALLQKIDQAEEEANHLGLADFVTRVSKPFFEETP